jgi:hypothetical protein
MHSRNRGGKADISTLPESGHFSPENSNRPGCLGADSREGD